MRFAVVITKRISKEQHREQNEDSADGLIPDDARGTNHLRHDMLGEAFGVIDLYVFCRFQRVGPDELGGFYCIRELHYVLRLTPHGLQPAPPKESTAKPVLLLSGNSFARVRYSQMSVGLRTGEFRNKNILVTGAGRGIGKRLALGFAGMGAKIALVGRSKAEIDLAHIEIEQTGGNALRIRADVTDPEQLALAVDRTRVVFGNSIDILICAAGTAGPLNGFLQTPLKAWTETIQINLLGVVHSCRAVLPSMIDKRAGKIIILACDSDVAPNLNFSAYATSKTAVVRFVETLAAEIADHNVQINCFDPGPAYTNLTDEIIRAESRLDPKVVSAAKETRRTGGVPPDKQLEHAAFLASEESNHITGKLIHVTDDWKKLRNASLRPDALTLRRASK